jgi:hypothetical protein
VHVLSVASTRRSHKGVQDSASDLCLNLLAKIGADSGCLVVIELADPCLITAKAPLKENQGSKVEFLSLVIDFVYNYSSSVDCGPFSRDSLPFLALPAQASLTFEFQFRR